MRAKAEFWGLFCIYVLSLLITACAVEVKDKNEPARDAPRSDYSLMASSLGLAPPVPLYGPYHIIQVGEQPDHYVVAFNLPSSVQRLERVDLTTQKKGFVQLSGERLDRGVEPGHTYTYQTPDANIAFQVEVPRDFVVDREISLASGPSPVVWRFHRLFLTSAGVVSFADRQFHIECDELIAEKGARIRTYAQGAPNDVRGRVGGRLEIKAWKARGDLAIDVSGEDGGHGSDGLAQEPQPPSKTFGGSMNGANGLPGKNGQPGGDSGSMQITIADSEGLNLSTDRRPGRGGNPGKGGPGQQGSAPYRILQPSGLYSTDSPGQNGASGVDGKLRGDDGKVVGEICLVTASGKLCSP